MRNSLAGYFKRISNNSQQKRRPASAHPYQLTPKPITMNQTFYHDQHTKPFLLNQNSPKQKLSHRNLSRMQNKAELKSNLTLNLSSKKGSQFRYQVLNPHCMKKVFYIPLENIVKVQEKKPLLGQGLKNMSKEQRKQFLGRRLKCLKRKDARRIKTQYDPQIEEEPFAVVGIKVL